MIMPTIFFPSTSLSLSLYLSLSSSISIPCSLWYMKHILDVASAISVAHTCTSCEVIKSRLHCVQYVCVSVVLATQWLGVCVWRTFAARRAPAGGMSAALPGLQSRNVRQRLIGAFITHEPLLCSVSYSHPLTQSPHLSLCLSPPPPSAQRLNHSLMCWSELQLPTLTRHQLELLSLPSSTTLLPSDTFHFCAFPFSPTHKTHEG